MADTMNHIERVVASLGDKPVDRLTTYPLAMGVCRRVVGDGKMTYRDWASDPKKYASGVRRRARSTSTSTTPSA